MKIAVLPTSDTSHEVGTAVQDTTYGNATTLAVPKQERISTAMVIGLSFCVIIIVALLVIIAVGYAHFITSSDVFLHTRFNALYPTAILHACLKYALEFTCVGQYGLSMVCKMLELDTFVNLLPISCCRKYNDMLHALYRNFLSIKYQALHRQTNRHGCD